MIDDRTSFVSLSVQSTSTTSLATSNNPSRLQRQQRPLEERITRKLLAIPILMLRWLFKQNGIAWSHALLGDGYYIYLCSDLLELNLTRSHRDFARREYVIVVLRAWNRSVNASHQRIVSHGPLETMSLETYHQETESEDDLSAYQFS
jgi:hypothetical protein